jgi:hypothetical protein
MIGFESSPRGGLLLCRVSSLPSTRGPVAERLACHIFSRDQRPRARGVQRPSSPAQTTPFHKARLNRFVSHGLSIPPSSYSSDKIGAAGIVYGPAQLHTRRRCREIAYGSEVFGSVAGPEMSSVSFQPCSTHVLDQPIGRAFATRSGIGGGDYSRWDRAGKVGVLYGSRWSDRNFVEYQASTPFFSSTHLFLGYIGYMCM